MAPRRSTPKAPDTVALITLPAGATFTLPESGRKGLVLRPPSTSSAYCRIWFRSDTEAADAAQDTGQTADAPKAKKPKAYEDKTIGASTQVIRTDVP